MATTNNNIVVVMIPLPAQGHLQPLLELARRILSSSNFTIPVHYAGSTTHLRQAQSRAHGWDPLTTPNLHFSEFQMPTLDNIPPDSNDFYPSNLIPSFYAALEFRQPVADLVKNLSAADKFRRVVVIHDILMSWVVQDVITIPNTEMYFFHAVSALDVCSRILEAKLNPDPVTPPADVAEILQELACMEPGSDSPPPLMVKYVEKQMSCAVNYGGRNIFSTCRPIDGIYLDLMQQAFKSYDEHWKTWGLGLFMNPLEMDQNIKKDTTSTPPRHHLLQWLDKQEPNSVLLVSFGSAASFTDEQIRELALGLEQSQQKFIWVLKEADRANVFAENINGGSSTRAFVLPEGYEKRAEGRGIVERGWAPQLEVLGHASTGGYLCHCGWNSVMESISMGVPIAAWPLHTDHPRTALLLIKGLKIGIYVRDWAHRNELVKAETIHNAVKILMDSTEGEKLRQKAAELKDTVKASFMDGGATKKDIESFMSYITR
ncbi:zeatin O-glucosyltransferase-like [Nicotiana tomentosiformis]|uniref:zeatin O-glucosyltransferase-like n=1 Tax=Nicotiana tomentosiformis TaxID=4098 RepID=UPI00051AB956|nr:zeatin O-glucosyltransferase-like [Nicotiana tomentosiformis]